MTAGPQRAIVDFIARMAEAWDGCGRVSLHISGREHRALVALAGLPIEVANTAWHNLSPEQRWALVQAAKESLELGRTCAWVFGEGRGA